MTFILLLNGSFPQLPQYIWFQNFCFRLVSATWILDLYIQHPLDIFVWISIRNLKLDTGKFYPWFHFLHIILLSFSLYHLNAYPVAEAKNLKVIFIPFFLSVSVWHSFIKSCQVKLQSIFCIHPLHLMLSPFNPSQNHLIPGQNYNSKRYMQPYIHSNSIDNSQNMEIT